MDAWAVVLCYLELCLSECATIHSHDDSPCCLNDRLINYKKEQEAVVEGCCASYYMFSYTGGKLHQRGTLPCTHECKITDGLRPNCQTIQENIATLNTVAHLGKGGKKRQKDGRLWKILAEAQCALGT